MNPFVSRFRRLLVGSAAAGLLIAASPASAMLYVLDFQTASQSGQIYFIAPEWSTHGALPGTISGIEVVNSWEITTGASFSHSGVKQAIKSIVPVGAFSNSFHKTNDNELLTFSNELHTTPPSSHFDPLHPWFTEGGFAVEAYNNGPGGGPADATIIDIFVKPGVNGKAATFDVESFDKSGHVILSSGTATLSVPSPAPASGYLGLAGLAFGAAALRLRGRLAAR
jgi:hypothetical protein